MIIQLHVNIFLLRTIAEIWTVPQGFRLTCPHIVQIYVRLYIYAL